MQKLLEDKERENALLRNELMLYRKMPAYNRKDMIIEDGREPPPSPMPTTRQVYRIISPVAVDIGGTLAKVVMNTLLLNKLLIQN